MYFGVEILSLIHGRSADGSSNNVSNKNNRSITINIFYLSSELPLSLPLTI